MGCKCDPGFMGPDCSMKLCRYGVDPLFIPSNHVYSADGVIEYDWDAPHFEKAFVEIISGPGMVGQFDLTLYDVYGEKYVLDALNFATYASGNYTSCEEIMAHFPNDNIKDTVSGTFHHQMGHKGGRVSSAYVGGSTMPFCTVHPINQTKFDADQVYANPFATSNDYTTMSGFDGQTGPGTITGFANSPLAQDDLTGIRYEFDYNRGNPGYIKDMFISNLVPEPRWAQRYDIQNLVSVYGYYGIIKQGEVAEYHDTNKNRFNPRMNRYMYSDDNYHQSGYFEPESDYGVTLPGYIIQAVNGSFNVLLSRDVHFYVEATTCDQDCKDYKTSSLLIFGHEYQINATSEEWLEVETMKETDYFVGPEEEDYIVQAHIFRPVTNITLSQPLYFPEGSEEDAVDFSNITYKWSSTRTVPRLDAIPEKVTVKAKLTQVYQYVSECSGRGTCDREAGVCKCFPGYAHDNCDTQAPVC